MSLNLPDLSVYNSAHTLVTSNPTLNRLFQKIDARNRQSCLNRIFYKIQQIFLSVAGKSDIQNAKKEFRIAFIKSLKAEYTEDDKKFIKQNSRAFKGLDHLLECFLMLNNKEKTIEKLKQIAQGFDSQKPSKKLKIANQFRLKISDILIQITKKTHTTSVALLKLESALIKAAYVEKRGNFIYRKQFEKEDGSIIPPTQFPIMDTKERLDDEFKRTMIELKALKAEVKKAIKEIKKEIKL